MNHTELHDLIYQYEFDFFRYDFCKNKENLEARLADGFIEYGASGRILTREGAIEVLLVKTADDDIVLSDYQTVQLCETVVQARFMAYRKNIDRKSRHSSIWVKRDGDWQVLFYQGTIIPQQP